MKESGTSDTGKQLGMDIEVLDQLTPSQSYAALGLIDSAALADGRQAVSEQGRLSLRRGGQPTGPAAGGAEGDGARRTGVRHLLLHEGAELVGYAQLEETDPVEPPAAELVVHPDHRHRGYGRALGRALLQESGQRMRLWAHGGHPAARHLAQLLGLTLFRELRQLRRPLAGLELSEPSPPPGIEVRTFRPGADDAEWLAVNAAAFAHHPEQGSLTQADLDDRKAEPWFDPHGFFLAVREGKVVGFHWTKVHSAEQLGEVYVLGVHPDEQGGGLGKALTTVGLRYLAYDRSMPTAMLYVDADNGPALAVYERMGFRTHETDLMYRTEG